MLALAIILMVVAITRLRVPAFLALLLISLGFGVVAGLPSSKVLSAISEGFGNLLGSIGLIIVLGSIIGVFLEKTGAALRLADAILDIAGQRYPGGAVALLGAIVGIPVFCDSGFILLSGLQRSLAQRRGLSSPALALALAGGLYTTHTLVPPTPGPIAAAGNLGATDYLGYVILLGLLISIPTAAIAAWWSKRAWKYGLSVSPALQEGPRTALSTEKLPGLVGSALPIVAPIGLIAAATATQMAGLSQGVVADVIAFWGHPLPALLVGLLCCIPLARQSSEDQWPSWVSEGIRTAGPIVIITGAGGAFGYVLRATSLSGYVGQVITGAALGEIGLLIVAYAIAALLKTAQGSSTAALVITSAMIAPLLPAAGLETPAELALTVMALGAGAMTLSHSNDSFFWVVSQFGGLEPREAYRFFSVQTALQGMTALACTLFLYALLNS